MQKQADIKDYKRVDIDGSKVSRFHKKLISYTESIGSAVLYGVCSASLAFLNKAVISSFSFNYPFFIMACQMILCIAVLEIFRISRVIDIPKYTFKLGKSFMWPSLFYAFHSITALHALGGLSIPMYAAVKRCAPIVTLFLSRILLQNKIPSMKLVSSVVCITVGCFLAGYGDLKFDPRAYRYGAMSVLLQGLYLTLAQKSLQNTSALDILHISSYNTVFIFALLSFCIESKEIREFSGFSDVALLFCLVLQTAGGVLLNYSLFLCTAKNSALTTSLVGVLKSILQTVIGLFTFGGIDFSILNVSGLSVNLFGGVLYTYLKYQEKQNAYKTVNSGSVL